MLCPAMLTTTSDSRPGTPMLGQYVGSDIADQVSKGVGEDDLAANRVAFRSRGRQRQGGDAGSRLPQRVGRHSGRKVCSRGSENVTAVKRGAHRMAPIRRVGQPPGPAALWRRRRTRGISIAEAGTVSPAHQGQEPVVRRNEAMVWRFQEDGRSVGAHAGVYHCYENAAVGKVGMRIRQGHGSVAHILRADAVGQIDDGRIRIN